MTYSNFSGLRASHRRSAAIRFFFDVHVQHLHDHVAAPDLSVDLRKVLVSRWRNILSGPSSTLRQCNEMLFAMENCLDEWLQEKT